MRSFVTFYLKNIDEAYFILKNRFEEQIKYINEANDKTRWNVDPQKVLIVKRYLDKGFKRAQLTGIGDDGYPKDVKIVAMLSSNGTPLKNMTAMQLFYLLQDRFSKMFSNKKQLNHFLWTTMNEWYDKKISKNGLLSHNKY